MIQISLSEMQTKPEQWVNDVDQAKSVMERILSHGSGFPEQRDNVRRYEHLKLQQIEHRNFSSEQFSQNNIHIKSKVVYQQ